MHSGAAANTSQPPTSPTASSAPWCITWRPIPTSGWRSPHSSRLQRSRRSSPWLGGFAGEEIRPWIWLASLVIDFVATRAAERADWHIQAGHFAERYGLLVIVALGETVIAIGVGLSGAEVSLALGVTLVAGFTAVAALWWSYFDWVSSRRRGPPPVTRGHCARCLCPRRLHLRPSAAHLRNRSVQCGPRRDRRPSRRSP